MINYKVKLRPEKRETLGNIRSNFLEMAFERFLYTRDRFTLETQAPKKLLLLKEIFSIFDEIHAIDDVRENFSDKTIFDPIFDLIEFLRNLLLHFPLFDTWDQIFISPVIASEMMKNRKGGKIAKYLKDNLGKEDIPFEVEYSGGTAKSSINRSAIKANGELTYVKDIISQKDAVSIIFDIVEHLYTATKQHPYDICP